MEDTANRNYCMLRGVLRDAPAFSHESRGERFYRFSLDVRRLSGAVDTIQIIAKQQLLELLQPDHTEKISIIGEMRSFNNKSGIGPRLMISAYAREIFFDNEEDENKGECHQDIAEPEQSIRPAIAHIVLIFLLV